MTQTVFIFTEVIWVLTFIMSIVIINSLDTIKKLIIKNHNTIMATLADFQKVAADINTATQNISTYVQGAGMSATDQDTALQAVQTAVTSLSAALPATENAPSAS